MRAGKQIRKRYLLLTSESPISGSLRQHFTNIILGRFPNLNKRLIWYSRGLIVRTDNKQSGLLRKALELNANGVKLKPTLTSGSIKKLKIATGEKWTRKPKTAGGKAPAPHRHDRADQQ